MSGSPLGHGDVVLSVYSLARSVTLDDRLRSAAAAGFSGVGLHVADYVTAREEGRTDAEIHRLLSRYDMVLHEVDALALDRLENLDAAVHMVNEFGAHHLQMQGNRPGTVEEAAEVVAGAAERVAGAGGSVAVEFLGCNNIATAADALHIVELSGQRNVGVQVDIWHHVRGANDWSLLESLPSDRVASVQINDGPLHPCVDDYLDDTRHHRCLPGDGEFDLARFLGLMYPSTCDLPLSVEVLDDDLMALSPQRAAEAMAHATRRVMDSSLPNASRATKSPS